MNDFYITCLRRHSVVSASGFFTVMLNEDFDLSKFEYLLFSGEPGAGYFLFGHNTHILGYPHAVHITNKHIQSATTKHV